jgi:ribonucleotide reductase alpha subunit
MYVTKRNGNKEKVHFDKITSRIEKLTSDLDKDIVDPSVITQKTCSSIYSGITTTELDNLACQICMNMVSEHPDYGILGSRIAISNHQKNTPEKFIDVVRTLYQNRDIQNNISPLVSDELLRISETYEDTLESMLDMKRDYLLDFFGFKTLERSYLLKINVDNGKGKKIIERPQHLFLRVAIGIHGDNLELVKRTYDSISLKQYTHATPTLFNAGTNTPQLSSCFLGYVEDSIEGIFDSYRECGIISKFAGGIGVHVSDIRSKGSYIRKTGGNSDGLMPLLKTYNSIARQFNQGGKRLGSFAIYLEVFHADVFTFLEAKKNVGSDDERARDLFYALWVSDLFMEKVEKDSDWYLMDSNTCPNLPAVYGEEFNSLYNKYVSEGKFVKKIKARELWAAIIASQIEHGMPYICYKDHVNRKTNQQNLGTIRSSNLCVSGDTKIQIKKDNKIQNIPIIDLSGQEIEVWNGKVWSKTIVQKTGENQKLLKISFSNLAEIKCTEYHKFYIQDNDGKEIMHEAKNLKIGMNIIPFTRWSLDSSISEVEISFRDIKVVNIEECPIKEDTFCFNEPMEHKGIFNGIIAGNCAEINLYSDVNEIAVCNLASICLPSILEYPNVEDISVNMPWYKLLSKEQQNLSKYFLIGELKLYTKEDCFYCKLLKKLLDNAKLKYKEIDSNEAEKLRIMSNTSLSVCKPFDTVPQLFSVLSKDDIQHLGGYDDCWKLLSPKINYKKLHSIAYDLVLNLNKVIDINFYPVEKTRVSNFKNRPLGIGVQGLANVFMLLRLPFTSDESRKINKNIFETIYHGAMNASVVLADKYGTYETFEGSPLSKGKFQFDLWELKKEELSGMWDWDEMRELVLSKGVRNSVLISLMPTASTASIFGNIESFEAITSNLYTRNVLSGVFTIINKHLVTDLIAMDLWNQDIKDKLFFYKGSVQKISEIPKQFRDIYKTVFEIDQKLLIKMSAERGPFICQSQSLNLFFENPTFKDLTSCHFYGWKQGLKTGSYYIRTKAAVSGQNFGMDINKEKMLQKQLTEKIDEEEEGCLNCSA